MHIIWYCDPMSADHVIRTGVVALASANRSKSNNPRSHNHCYIRSSAGRERLTPKHGTPSQTSFVILTVMGVYSIKLTPRSYSTTTFNIVDGRYALGSLSITWFLG